MSELKYYKLFHRASALTSPNFISVVEFGTNEEIYSKPEVDEFLADLEESHKMEVEQLLMKIAGLEKLVETADKLLKPKGGFTVKDIAFNGVKLEGLKGENHETST